MDSTNFYFIQEYFEGGKELLDYIQDVDLCEKAVVGILKKLITTSMYLTNSGFQFTDLKPHSIFIMEDNVTLKVTDFDYKIMFDQNKIHKNRYGSVYFVSPEVIDLTHNADWLVWNCASIAFLLLSGRQIFEECGFKSYQNVVKSCEVDLEIKELEQVSLELMELLEKMLNEDQFLRLSLVESANQNVLLSKKYGPDEVNIPDPDIVKRKLKIYQGELQMYSGMWGIVYTHVIWCKKWKKKIAKNIEKVGKAGKVPRDKVREAYKFFTIDPKILQFHEDVIFEYLGEKSEFEVKEIIDAMIKIDMDHFYEKIKDSFKYFEDDGPGIFEEDLLRVLKRTHTAKEAKMVEEINNHKNAD